MDSLFKTFKGFLAAHFGEPELNDQGDDDDSDMLAFRMEDEEGHAWSCLATAHEELGILLFYSMLEPRTPPEQRSAMMEFITAANFDLLIGNFEMDLEDGEVRFKTSIDLGNVEPEPQLFDNLVHANLLIVSRYYEALIEVMNGEATPAEALAEMEEADLAKAPDTDASTLN